MKYRMNAEIFSKVEDRTCKFENLCNFLLSLGHLLSLRFDLRDLGRNILEQVLPPFSISQLDQEIIVFQSLVCRNIQVFLLSLKLIAQLLSNVS